MSIFEMIAAMHKASGFVRQLLIATALIGRRSTNTRSARGARATCPI